MPFRISIPLPGPASWSPARRKKPTTPKLAPEQWEVMGRQIHSVGERWGQRIENDSVRLDRKITEADRRHQVWHDKEVAELDTIRQLPPWPRFVAAIKFPLRRR
ncbi:hypothetical protein [Pseudonocardia sp. SID8383]|uniref:hypothetical protein n=1 Tax=Pseudonocardia sp. SID8383 TaxID=2690363 RepID=UPI00136E7D78|nr:hypothetical protein [Pseudonocardia sp. SID8383]MYW71071.1 hypothetical protein [Pseudonocardia sp. SID8383]